MAASITIKQPSSGLSRIPLGERNLDLRLSARAQEALRAQREPLEIEMELYFSCFLRKRVNFLSDPHADAVARTPLSDTVTVSFRPVMTKACAVADAAGTPGLEILPLVRGSAFMPKWLSLDYGRGGWSGEFGF